jgi:hypothetical protein
MRIVLIALMVALLAIPAQARGGKKGGAQNHPQSADAKKKKASAEEKAAKSALDRLPDKPFDPWHTMR